MKSYDTWVLVMLAPAVWWLVAMVRAVIDVRSRALPITEWEPSVEDGRRHH
jgi:hypothetical protein